MATKYEYWDTLNGETGRVCYGVNWSGQTFTPSITHQITSVKLNCYKRDSPNDSPGDITVSIRATSGGLPTGGDLASGTIAEADIPSWGVAGYDWVEATFSSTCVLVADTKYAIIVKAPDGDAQNYVGLRMTVTGADGYTRGNHADSYDSGVNWEDSEGGAFYYDMFFEEWGNLVPVYPTDAITRVTNLVFRYNRKEQLYSLVAALGEVTSDFGLPEWLSSPQPSVQKSEKETLEEAIKRAEKAFAESPDAQRIDRMERIMMEMKKAPPEAPEVPSEVAGRLADAIAKAKIHKEEVEKEARRKRLLELHPGI